MCCKVFPLPVLDKPENQWCQFLSPAGCICTSMGSRKSASNMRVTGWNTGMPDDCRPDRIGVVATECGSVSVAGKVLPIFVLTQAEPEACRAPAAQAWIDSMVAGGWVLLLVCGPDMQMAYDRSRYAAISAAEIEVAFRYERSQDAEELKSLGAVSEDYRPLTCAEAEATLRDRTRRVVCHENQCHANPRHARHPLRNSRV